MNSETINTRRARQNIKIDLVRAPSFQTAVRLVTKSDWIFNHCTLPPPPPPLIIPHRKMLCLLVYNKNNSRPSQRLASCSHAEALSQGNLWSARTWRISEEEPLLQPPWEWVGHAPRLLWPPRVWSCSLTSSSRVCWPRAAWWLAHQLAREWAMRGFTPSHSVRSHQTRTLLSNSGSHTPLARWCPIHERQPPKARCIQRRLVGIQSLVKRIHHKKQRHHLPKWSDFFQLHSPPQCALPSALGRFPGWFREGLIRGNGGASLPPMVKGRRTTWTCPPRNGTLQRVHWRAGIRTIWFFNVWRSRDDALRTLRKAYATQVPCDLRQVWGRGPWGANPSISFLWSRQPHQFPKGAYVSPLCSRIQKPILITNCPTPFQTIV